MEGINKNKLPIRHVKFKNVTYSLTGNRRMDIIPVPYWNGHEYNNLIIMGIEKYLINVEGNLRIENIRQSTLDNFDKILFDYIEALRGLKWTI